LADQQDGRPADCQSNKQYGITAVRHDSIPA
jgi:hypothetical protein